MYTATEIRPRVFAIEDGDVRMYLICGTARALLLDTGYGTGDLKQFVHAIYPGPITVAHTHTHGDHTGADRQFDAIFAAQEDHGDLIAVGAASEALHPLCGGDRFDLGDRVIIAHNAPGHTAHSMFFSDDANRLLFTGDHVSDVTVYLCMPGADLNQYCASLQWLLAHREKYDVFLGCHGKAEQYASGALRLLDCIDHISGREGIRETVNAYADVFFQKFTWKDASVFLPLAYPH